MPETLPPDVGQYIESLNMNIRGLQNKLPLLATRTQFASGEEPFAFAGGNLLAKTITFPTGRFSAAPIWVGQLRTAVRMAQCYISTSATATSIGVTVATADSSAVTGTIYVQWIAFLEV